MRLLIRWMLAVLLGGIATGATAQAPDTTALASWHAGLTVTAEAVEAFGGEDRCFAAEPIPDAVWERMQGKTYKQNPYIGRADLRHVRALHWDYDDQIHVGEMVCNKLIADRLVHILRQLYEAKYPIQRMLLPDVYDADDERQMRDNNSSCFCYRAIAGSTRLSKHARGLAVDINTLYNPCYKDRPDGTRHVQPATAAKYCDRSVSFPYKIDHQDLCYRLFTEAGFSWGGDWRSSKDFQHFELKGNH
ncbi:MAG: M15 family metallopeptidase [Prevotella sp.]|nr:M15 family metallopeptidase [Prevotella sp.]